MPQKLEESSVKIETAAFSISAALLVRGFGRESFVCAFIWG